MKRLATLVLLAVALTLGAHANGLDQDAGSSVSTGPGLFNPYVSLDPSQVDDMRMVPGPGWDEKICADEEGLHCHMEHHDWAPADARSRVPS